jgi:hypothetical protein
MKHVVVQEYQKYLDEVEGVVFQVEDGVGKAPCPAKFKKPVCRS